MRMKERKEIKIDPKDNDKKINFILVVKNPFNGYRKGQHISDEQSIQSVIDKNQLHNCLKVQSK